MKIFEIVVILSLNPYPQIKELSIRKNEDSILAMIQLFDLSTFDYVYQTLKLQRMEKPFEIQTQEDCLDNILVFTYVHK